MWKVANPLIWDLEMTFLLEKWLKRIMWYQNNCFKVFCSSLYFIPTCHSNLGSPGVTDLRSCGRLIHSYLKSTNWSKFRSSHVAAVIFIFYQAIFSHWRELTSGPSFVSLKPTCVINNLNLFVTVFFSFVYGNQSLWGSFSPPSSYLPVFVWPT